MERSKYNIGDKVKIKSLIWYEKNKDSSGVVNVPFSFLRRMSEYCEMNAIITRVYQKYYSTHPNEYSYSIDIDDGEWEWSSHMFEGIKFQRRKKLKKLKKCR